MCWMSLPSIAQGGGTWNIGSGTGRADYRCSRIHFQVLLDEAGRPRRSSARGRTSRRSRRTPFGSFTRRASNARSRLSLQEARQHSRVGPRGSSIWTAEQFSRRSTGPVASGDCEATGTDDRSSRSELRSEPRAGVGKGRFNERGNRLGRARHLCRMDPPAVDPGTIR